MNKLYILTLNWNGEDKLKKLVPTTLSSLNGIDYEWIVKDNNSSDNSVDYLKSNNINVIKYKNNLQNFSEGCNYLFNTASPDDKDLIMLLNNDVIFNDNNSIKNMLSLINKDEEIGAVGAKLLYTDQNTLQHAGVVFNPTYKTPMHFRAKQKADENASLNREFQAVTGAVLITKADYFRNTQVNSKSGNKGMDEKYHWAFDDVDLCLSIKYNMQKKIVYCGNTNIYHEESASLKKNPTNKLFLTHNLQYFFQKWNDRYKIDQDIYTQDNKYNLYK